MGGGTELNSLERSRQETGQNCGTRPLGKGRVNPEAEGDLSRQHPCASSPLYASVWTFLQTGHQKLSIETEEMKFEKDPKLRIQIQLRGTESETPCGGDWPFLCGGHL